MPDGEYLYHGTSRFPAVHRSEFAVCQSVRSRVPCHDLLRPAYHRHGPISPSARGAPQSGRASRTNEEVLEATAYLAVCTLRQAYAVQKKVKLF